MIRIRDILYPAWLRRWFSRPPSARRLNLDDTAVAVAAQNGGLHLFGIAKMAHLSSTRTLSALDRLVAAGKVDRIQEKHNGQVVRIVYRARMEVNGGGW